MVDRNLNQREETERELETELTLSNGTRVRVIGDLVRGCMGSIERGCGAIEVIDAHGKKALIPGSEYDPNDLYEKGHEISHALLSEKCAVNHFTIDCQETSEEAYDLVKDFDLRYERCPKPDEPILYHN